MTMQKMQQVIPYALCVLMLVPIIFLSLSVMNLSQASISNSLAIMDLNNRVLDLEFREWVLLHTLRAQAGMEAEAFADMEYYDGYLEMKDFQHIYDDLVMDIIRQDQE